MTLDALLTKVQEEKPNSFEDLKLIGYTNDVEAQVCEQLQYSLQETPVYENTETDRAQNLVAPPPYDRLYVSWLKAQIDYANEEYASYQLNAQQFMADFEEFSNWVVRTNQSPEEHFPHRFRSVM